MHPDNLLDKLAGVKKNGDVWSARCPAHHDKKNSLSVSLADDERLLIHCHAGCATADVVKAVGLRLVDLFPTKPAATLEGLKKRGTILASYDYKDADGKLLYQVVRFDPKDFRQRQPDGKGWNWSLKGVERVPYQLPELLAADPDLPVFICEGEKDADQLASLNLVATTNAGGAGKWLKKFSKFLRGRQVVILPDNDVTGQSHAEQVAASVRDVAASVTVLPLPDLPEKGDVTDWFDAGGTRDRLLKLAADAPAWQPQLEDCASNADSVPRKSQAQLIVELAGDVELFHTPEGDAYGTVPVASHQETWRLRSKSFKQWLARRFYVELQKTPHTQALSDGMGVLEGRALFDGPEHEVHVRVASHDGNIFVDIGDKNWNVIKITRSSWTVDDTAPVRFRRGRAMLPLPIPLPAGVMAELRQFVNVQDDDWPLILGWLVASLRPVGPYPILCLNGEQGSAKSTTARVLRCLVDPNSAPLRCEPKEPRDLAIAANNGWVVALDNLSYIRTWLSDALCRLSTGGGFATRELFTDSDEAIFYHQRPTILTGIEELCIRGDLIDRSLIVTLPRIPEHRRQPESAFWSAFDDAQPRILGALVSAVSVALRNLAGTKLPALPRMADFALWATAAEPALGLEDGAFMAAYDQNRHSATDLAIEASPVAAAVKDFCVAAGDWTGSCTELLAELDERAEEKIRRQRERQKAWPKTPKTLSDHLRRAAPNLRDSGIDVEFTRSGRSRMVKLCRREANLASSASLASPEPESSGISGELSDAQVTQCDGKVTQTVAAPGHVNLQHGVDLRSQVTHGDAGDAQIAVTSIDEQREVFEI